MRLVPCSKRSWHAFYPFGASVCRGPAGRDGRTMLIFFGALVGWWIAGFKGFLVGGALGYLIGRLARVYLGRRLDTARSQFVDSTFEVMGALCKADGVVTRDEIRAVEEMFLRLRLSEAQKASAKAAFNRGKEPGFDLDGAARRFAESTAGNPLMLQLFLQLQLAAIAADGVVQPVEREMLVRVARQLGLAEYHIAQLEALLRAANTAGGEAAAPNRPPSRDRLQDAYTALGLTPEATEAEIKRAYRKMISETHPDKLASQGLPQNLRDLAEERAREINAAYEVLKRARNFT